MKGQAFILRLTFFLGAFVEKFNPSYAPSYAVFLPRIRTVFANVIRPKEKMPRHGLNDPPLCTKKETKNIRRANRTPLFFIHSEVVRAIHPQSKTVKNRAKYRPILEKSSEKGMGIGVINGKDAMARVGQVAIFSAIVCIQ
ncbi:MAG: hypothetical protein IJX56_01440 [Alistipes sp.]|nr:hypothetical protein [Alistipes sp.]